MVSECIADAELQHEHKKSLQSTTLTARLLLLQVYAHFTEQGPNASATFSLKFLEGMNWKQAAALFDQADIVVSPHGAQTSQALFMPMHGQFVHMDNNAGHAMLTAFVIDVSPPVCVLLISRYREPLVCRI